MVRNAAAPLASAYSSPAPGFIRANQRLPAETAQYPSMTPLRARVAVNMFALKDTEQFAISDFKLAEWKGLIVRRQ